MSVMNVPVFIDISLEEQAEELRGYFKGLGAEISAERSPKGIEDDLYQIIGVCDACFKDSVDASRIDEVLNGIVSMLTLVTNEKSSENLILAFCEKLTKAPNNALGLTCLKVLWSLYQSLDVKSPMRFHVYMHLVKLAGKAGEVDLVYKDIETFKSQIAANSPSNEHLQKLLRLLHEVLLESKKSDQASEVMVLLLGTYTTENASMARDEAFRCIRASLADPQTFLLDHLLQLKPVKFLEGDPIHDLLKIFVSEKLDAYKKFYEGHKKMVSGDWELNHDELMTKMRLLTFMQVAETKSQISFGEIQRELQLGDDEVEEFLIELLKTKLVRAKLDQANGQVHVSSTMHRTFTKQHWHNLHGLLTSWRDNLHTIREQVGHLASAQIEMIRKNNVAA